VILGDKKKFEVYVLFGTNASAPSTYATLKGKTDTNAGTSVCVGDVNGDGYGDVIIGAPTGSDGGRVYVYFGNKDLKDTATVDMDTALDGNNGFVLTANAASDHLGWAVASADVDGDGIMDVITSSPDKALVYVLYGARGSFPASIILNDESLNGRRGVTYTAGGDYTMLGRTLAAGRLDSDKYADIVVSGEETDIANVLVVKGKKRDTDLSRKIGDNLLARVKAAVAAGYVITVAVGDSNRCVFTLLCMCICVCVCVFCACVCILCTCVSICK
jgi:hypothetical protein